MKKSIALAAAASVLVALASTAVSAQVITRYPPKTNDTPSTFDCDDAMGHLRRVTAAQIRALPRSQNISIQPICEGDPSQNIAVLRADGNVGSLQSTIGAHPAIALALADAHYIDRDVVGIRFGGGNTLILYVHKFGR